LVFDRIAQKLQTPPPDKKTNNNMFSHGDHSLAARRDQTRPLDVLLRGQAVLCQGVKYITMVGGQRSLNEWWTAGAHVYLHAHLQAMIRTACQTRHISRDAALLMGLGEFLIRLGNACVRHAALVTLTDVQRDAHFARMIDELDRVLDVDDDRSPLAWLCRNIDNLRMTPTTVLNTILDSDRDAFRATCPPSPMGDIGELPVWSVLCYEQLDEVEDLLMRSEDSLLCRVYRTIRDMMLDIPVPRAPLFPTPTTPTTTTTPGRLRMVVCAEPNGGGGVQELLTNKLRKVVSGALMLDAHLPRDAHDQMHQQATESDANHRVFCGERRCVHQLTMAVRCSIGLDDPCVTEHPYYWQRVRMGMPQHSRDGMRTWSERMLDTLRKRRRNGETRSAFVAGAAMLTARELIQDLSELLEHTAKRAMSAAVGRAEMATALMAAAHMNEQLRCVLDDDVALSHTKDRDYVTGRDGTSNELEDVARQHTMIQARSNAPMDMLDPRMMPGLQRAIRGRNMAVWLLTRDRYHATNRGGGADAISSPNAASTHVMSARISHRTGSLYGIWRRRVLPLFAAADVDAHDRTMAEFGPHLVAHPQRYRQMEGRNKEAIYDMLRKAWRCDSQRQQDDEQEDGDEEEQEMDHEETDSRCFPDGLTITAAPVTTADGEDEDEDVPCSQPSSPPLRVIVDVATPPPRSPPAPPAATAAAASTSASASAADVAFLFRPPPLLSAPPPYVSPVLVREHRPPVHGAAATVSARHAAAVAAVARLFRNPPRGETAPVAAAGVVESEDDDEVEEDPYQVDQTDEDPYAAAIDQVVYPRQYQHQQHQEENEEDEDEEAYRTPPRVGRAHVRTLRHGPPPAEEAHQDAKLAFRSAADCDW